MNRLAKRILTAGLNGLVLGLLALPAAAAQPLVRPIGFPLYFEAGPAAANAPAQFIARGLNYQFQIAPAEVGITLRDNLAGPAAMRMEFVGGNARAEIRGDTELPGKINYLTGKDPAQWRTGLPMFAKVRVEGLYPGVNLVYYGNSHHLEYDFTLAPGVDPGGIAIHFDGTDKISINPQGELVLKLGSGELRQPKPVIYQTVDGARREIAGGYRLVDAHTVAFAVGQHDPQLPLTIDPLLGYSTYFGGSAADTAWSVAVDANNSVYIAGQTLSKQFSASQPFTTPGAFQPVFGGGNLSGDAFVFKFDGSSGYPAYVTYLGGSADDGALSLALNASGNVYVAGFTDSSDFPTTTNAYATKISGTYSSSFKSYPIDAFVTELDPGGSNLVYSTYLGGSGMDCANSIALDSAGYAYVTGYTYSSNFPTLHALQTKLACSNSIYFNANAFITKISPNGKALSFSTYFGGTNFDEGKGIAVDTNGYVYVTGFTSSTNFPNTNAFQTLLNDVTNRIELDDAFVVKLDPTGTNLVYSTFLGSTNADVGNAIAVDNTGAAYVTGWSCSSNFPNTVGQSIPGLHSFVATNTRPAVVVTNVFLTKITNGVRAGIAWSALFGGKGVDVGNSLALDPAGDVFVTGSASSTDFPITNTPGLMSGTNAGRSDAFVIGFNTNATALLYSTYLGGKDNDYGYGIAVATNGDAYVVGQTYSVNFLIYNADYTNRNGASDAFLTKITLAPAAPEISLTPTNQTVGVGSNAIFSVSGTAVAPFFIQWQKDGTNLVNGGRISGVTNVTLVVSNAQVADSGTYSVTVTNYGGSATTNGTLTVMYFPPLITLQPTNQTVGGGTTVTQLVSATGTAPLSYQWQLNGTNLMNGSSVDGSVINGATTNLLTILNVQPDDGGIYTVIVTNQAGSVTSSNANLTVISAPIITQQPVPANQTLQAGATVKFTVTAIGAVPLIYHWRVNGLDLKNGGPTNGPIVSGASSNVLTISNLQMTNSGAYSVVITNFAGFVTSSDANLTVTNVAPTIQVQPISQTNGVGATATLSVTATGTAPLSYHWQLNGTNLLNGGFISGVTSNMLTISNLQTNNSGTYSVTITNVAGSVTSSNAILMVASAPVIVVQPVASLGLTVGSNATLSVTAVGIAPLSYQWRINGTNLINGTHISGATSNVLFIINAITNNTGIYTVLVTNRSGSVISSNAALSVTNVPATITTQPTGQTVGVGATVTMKVTATGSPVLTYQWQLNGTNLVNGGPTNGPIVSGATANTLIIRYVQTNSSGNYTVIVRNPAGSTTSSNALLTVTALPLILVQPDPTNQTLGAGSTVTYSVTAVGTSPLGYQWQFNGTNLVNGTNQADGDIVSGATTNVLMISNLQTNNSGAYSVAVMNSAGSTLSSNADLLVVSAPVITMQPTPTNQSMEVGATATITVTAVGIMPLSYQWQLNGTNLMDGDVTNGESISGSTNEVLTISNVQTNDTGSYSVIITNIAGSAISADAELLVTNIPPEITLQPMDQTVPAGTTVSFTTEGNGTTPFTFQWQKNLVNLVDDGVHISGATNFTLIITNVQPADDGNYRLLVTNPGGTLASSNAVLTVLGAPQFGNIVASGGGGFILSGTGGETNGTYYVLVSSNLLVPRTNWTRIATNQFDSLGGFIFTNTAQTNSPHEFYLLELP